MNHINRLLIKAREAAGESKYCHAIGFVDYDEESSRYIAKPQLWDGKPGSGTEALDLPNWWHDDWTTEEEATGALNRLFHGFGIPEKNSLIFVLDFGLDDCT